MRSRMLASGALLALTVVMVSPPAQAVHWYRGPGGGCSAADGELTDASDGIVPAADATVRMEHNLFRDVDAGTPVTTIPAGGSVRWTWNSAHCHSARADDLSWTSGYFYPAQAPASPQVVPGFFEYPVLEERPTLAFTRTFPTPGEYRYSCEHHATIGMVGVVIVE